MEGEWPQEVDHIDHVKLNNIWRNLRSVSSTDNGRNASLSKNNTSGHNGIYWHKQNSKWVAEIMVDREKISLGSYLNLSGAIKARREADIKYNFHTNHGAKAL